MMDIIWMATSGGSPIFSWEAYPEMGTFIVWKGPEFFYGPYEVHNGLKMRLG